MFFYVFEFVYLKVFEFVMTNQYYVFSNHFVSILGDKWSEIMLFLLSHAYPGERACAS